MARAGWCEDCQKWCELGWALICRTCWDKHTEQVTTEAFDNAE